MDRNRPKVDRAWPRNIERSVTPNRQFDARTIAKIMNDAASVFSKRLPRGCCTRKNGVPFRIEGIGKSQGSSLSARTSRAKVRRSASL